MPTHPIYGNFLATFTPMVGVSIGLPNPISGGLSDPAGMISSYNPHFFVDASSSMLGVLESTTLDLDPSNASSLDIITATRAGTATYTDANGTIQLADPNTVRVDHVDGVPMILVEPAATNLIENSEDFSESLYIRDSGVTIGTTNHVSPAGSEDATKIEVTDNGRIYANLTSATYATSLYLKSGTFSHFKIAGNNLDLQSQTFAGGTVEFVGDGWYRISFTSTSARSFQVQAYPDANYAVHTDSGDYFIWGVQVETGTIATSYIPTSGSTVTRAKDELVIDGSDFTNFYNQSEGTIYIETIGRELDFNYIYSISDGSGSNRFVAIYHSFNHLFVQTAGVLQGAPTAGTFIAGTLGRYAASFKENDLSVAIDGGNVVTDTSATLPTVSKLNIGSRENGNEQLNGHIKRLLYWPHHSDNI